MAYLITSSSGEVITERPARAFQTYVEAVKVIRELRLTFPDKMFGISGLEPIYCTDERDLDKPWMFGDLR